MSGVSGPQLFEELLGGTIRHLSIPTETKELRQYLRTTHVARFNEKFF